MLLGVQPARLPAGEEIRAIERTTASGLGGRGRCGETLPRPPVSPAVYKPLFREMVFQQVHDHRWNGADHGMPPYTRRRRGTGVSAVTAGGQPLDIDRRHLAARTGVQPSACPLGGSPGKAGMAFAADQDHHAQRALFADHMPILDLRPHRYP